MISTFVASALIACGPSAAPQDSRVSFAIRAATLYAKDGQAIERAVLWIEDGKIRAVGQDVSLPAGTPTIVHDGAVTAGLIAAHGYASMLEESDDPTRPELGDANVGVALDGEHSDFSELLRAGVTTVVLGPQPSNLIGGSTAAVKCAGSTTVLDRAQLQISLIDAANRINRGPTSPSGALDALRNAFAEPSGTVALAVTGRMPVLIAAEARHEIQRAADLAREYKLRGALLFAPLAGELTSTIASSGLAVVFAPIGVGAERRAIDSVVATGKARIPFAFAMETPATHRDALRMSAAMCVRAGLDRAAAMRALTSDAAKIAGVDSRVGSLERGLDADFVLWSGDPLDLSSSVVGVYVDGIARNGGRP